MVPDVYCTNLERVNKMEEVAEKFEEVLNVLSDAIEGLREAQKEHDDSIAEIEVTLKKIGELLSGLKL